VEGSGFAGLVSVGCSFPGQPLRFVASGESTYVFQVMANGGIAGFDLVEPPAPPYDDVSNAVPVSPTPFVLEPLDASLATSSVDDPNCLNSGKSVWLTYTPPTDMQLEAAVQPDFLGEDRDFTLSAWTGAPGVMTQLACTANELTPNGKVMAHVSFEAKAGVPIYFMVGTSPGGLGGTVYFALQSPLRVVPTIDRSGSVTQNGFVTITGTATCSRPVNPSLTVEVQQIFANRAIATAMTATGLHECSTTAQTWFASATSSSGVRFGPGKAEAHVPSVQMCDELGCQPGWLVGNNDNPPDTRTINLRRVR